MKKKSQVTLLVILGIVVLIAILLTIYYFNTIKKQQFFLSLFEQDDSQIITQQLRECINTITKPILQKTIKQGGYLEDTTLFNSVFDGQAYYSIAYDSNDLSKSIATRYDLKEYLENKIKENYWDCMFELYSDMSKRGKNFNVIINSVNVYVNDSYIIAEYEFELITQRYNKTIFTSNAIKSNVGYFLRVAEELTTLYKLSETTKHDPLLNYEICQKFNSEYKIKPKYFTDFLEYLAGKSDIAVVIYDKFFIIKVSRGKEENKEVFAFAIKPEIRDDLPIC